MENNFDKMKSRIQDIIDPNNPYSYEDFNNEFITPSDAIHPNVGYTIPFKFVNKSNNPDPEYATNGSSGFDLRANLEQPLVIPPTEYKLIKTGLYFDIPNNMEITIRSRSGLAYKHGISVLNGVGTIDSDYKGEIGVLLINHGKENFIINNGDRIAQGVLSSVFGKNLISFNKVIELSDDTERSGGGYGSTGVK